MKWMTTPFALFLALTILSSCLVADEALAGPCGVASDVNGDLPTATLEEAKMNPTMRELERLLGKKTMENEILREALAKSQAKKPTLRPLSLPKGGSR